jgi:hypothetical protein
VSETHDEVEDDPGEDEHDVRREHGAHMPNLAPNPDGRATRRRAPAVALVVLIASFVAACGGSGTLDSEALTKEIEAVESLAAEGALLADGAAREKTTSSFTRIHADELAKTASDQATKLRSSPVAPGLERRARAGAALASDVAALLAALAESRSEREAASAIAAKLEDAARTARRLAEGL